MADICKEAKYFPVKNEVPFLAQTARDAADVKSRMQDLCVVRLRRRIALLISCSVAAFGQSSSNRTLTTSQVVTVCFST
jgi:hypothetical protein